MDGYGWLARGAELHRHGGRRPAAETAYREAIKHGRQDAWLFLGHLLWGQTGRLAEEEAAYRAAMNAGDPEVVAEAALRLGDNCLLLRRDLPAARQYYDRALVSGIAKVRRSALTGLLHVDVQTGDLEGARDRIRRDLVDRATEWDADLATSRIPRFFASALIRVASVRAYQSLTRRRVRLKRRYWAAVGRSHGATAAHWRFHAARARLGQRATSADASFRARYL